MKSLFIRGNQEKESSKHVVRPGAVLLKAILLFIVIDLVFTLINPNSGSFLIYGRQQLKRFPQFWSPRVDNNGNVTYERLLSSDLGLLFASHSFSHKKAVDEFRVAVFGDSATWGTALYPTETMAEQINAMNLITCDGKRIIAYNLGYPNNALSKDLLIMDYAQRYEPDLNIWLFSLLAFMKPSQNFSFTEQNVSGMINLVEKYGYEFEIDTLPESSNHFLDRTIIGRRQTINLAINLSVSNLLVRSLGVDDPRVWTEHDIHRPSPPTPMEYFMNLSPGTDLRNQMVLSALPTAQKITEGNIIFVNEPVQVEGGEYENFSYNEIYPRWAYDQYRSILTTSSSTYRLNYVDLWNFLPAELFTSSIFHIGSEGEKLLAAELAQAIQTWSCSGN